MSLALDGAKRQCKVRTSNAGHALAMGIADRDRARRVADGLMHTRFYSGWGVRTVASGEARYNPMSYHNGSIWPHDNAFIAQGLARYGHKSGIHHIFDGLVRATTYMEHRRIPELYCGFRRRPGRGPTLYPAACSPQAWAAGAPFSMLQTMLGLRIRPRGAQDIAGQSFAAGVRGPDRRAQSHARRREHRLRFVARTAVPFRCRCCAPEAICRSPCFSMRTPSVSWDWTEAQEDAFHKTC